MYVAVHLWNSNNLLRPENELVHCLTIQQLLIILLVSFGKKTMITGKSHHTAITKHSKCFYKVDNILQIVL